MQSKITLKETAGTKIIGAALLVCYYWMWARRDWHDYCTIIQNMVFTFTVIFFALVGYRLLKYGKEENNALKIQNLRRADAMVVADIAVAFVCAVTFADGRTTGYALVGTILVLTVVRFILFCAMDRKES